MKLQSSPTQDSPDLAPVSIILWIDSDDHRSISTVSSSRAERYDRTIAALQAQTDSNWRLILIGEEELAQTYADQVGGAWFIPFQGGQAAAYNLAVESVSTPWLMSLEAGIVWPTDWIARHRAMWQDETETASLEAICGAARTVVAIGDLVQRLPSRPEIPPEWQHSIAAIEASVRPEPLIPELADLLTWNAVGSIANLAVRTETWRQLGGLDTGLPLAWSVWDLGLRLAHRGALRFGGERFEGCELHEFDLHGIDLHGIDRSGMESLAQPEITPTSCEAWLDRQFDGLDDPYRRLRSRSRRNLLRWYTARAIALDWPHVTDWLEALMGCDRDLAMHNDWLEACVMLLDGREDQARLETEAPTELGERKEDHETLILTRLIQAIELDPLPLISVIVPVKDGAETITATIRSALAQTCHDFEILVIDDGSTDETIDRLAAIDDDRLWVYSFDNAGVSASRNRGLRLALGRYCAFLDADDCWTPDKLQAQHQALEASGDRASGRAAVAYSWVDYIDDQGDGLRQGAHLTANGDVFAHLLLTNFLENGSNLLVDTHVARRTGAFDPAMSPAEDWDYALRLAWKAHFVCVPEAQVLYRLLPTSASAQVTQTASRCRAVLDRAFSLAPTPLQNLRPYALANLYRYLAYRTLTPPWNRDRCQQALDYLQQAIDADPLDLPDVYRPLIHACQTHIHLPRSAAQRLYPDDQWDFSALLQATKSAPYPLVSVIIPAYNAANMIGETIASVQAQTLSDWEIVLIDDGSTDETVAVVEAIGDPRIHVYRYPNAGQGESRNRGACHATGEFFAFLDADDLWLPDKLERMVKAIGANPKAAVAYSWIDHIDEDGNFLTRACDYTRQGYVYDKLLLSDFIAGGSNLMLWRGAFGMVGGFNPDLPPAEDRDMWLRLAEKFHFVAIESPLLRYRQVPQSQSANVTRMERSQCRVIEAAFDRAPDNFPFTKLPELLPYYKRQVLANTYKYLTFKQLDAPVDQASARIALRLFQVVLDNEPTLKQRHRRFITKLWLRIWLATVLPPDAMIGVFKRFGTFHRLHRDLLSYTRMSLRDLLPEDLRQRYAKLTNGSNQT